MIEHEKMYYPETNKEVLQFISNICIDYDGYRKAENLMELVDEIKGIADKQLQKIVNKEAGLARLNRKKGMGRY